MRTKITTRPATHGDIPAILALHEKQQRIQGTNYEPPPFETNCIVDAVVGELESGEIVGCYYVEAVAEVRFVAINPRFTAQARREVDSAMRRLKAIGFRWVEVFVPRQMKSKIEKPLQRAGFECVDEELAHFTRDIRGKL